MRKIGFVISHKNNERRRALLPNEVKKLRHPEQLYFETGYGDSVNYSDEDYIAAGAKIVSRREALDCDIVTDVKLGDADFLGELTEPKILFGWAHAVQKTDFTTEVLRAKHTVLAWENIYEKGRYVFYRNREVAGEAAILQAFLYCGKMPYDCKVAIIGNGQTAKGAMRILHGLGADVQSYPRKLYNSFRENLGEYDVIVNCVLWDTNRTDRLIYKSDLASMKKGAMIVDVSCDPELEIETSHPTTIDNPVYTVDGIIHYAVDNTPAMFPITVTKIISEGLAKYIDPLVEGQDIPALADALVIDKGVVRDDDITSFRERLGLKDN